MPIRRELRPLYRTPEYRNAREGVESRARGRCEHCLRPRNELVEMISGKDADSRLFLLWRMPGRKHWTNGRGWPATKADYQVLADVSSWRRYMSRTQLQMAHVDNDAANNSDENLRQLCAWCHLSWDAGAHKATRATRRDGERPLFRMLEAAG